MSPKGNVLAEWVGLLFTLSIVVAAVVYINRTAGRQPLSRLRRHGLYVAWWLVFFFPCGMGCGLLRALWPEQQRFGWGSLAFDGGFVLLVSFVMGNLIAFLAGPAELPEKRSPAPKLPDVGPRWADRTGTRPAGAQPPDAVQVRDVLTETDEPK
jgi:hypothetical protein